MTNMNYEVFRNKMVAAIEAGALGEQFSKVEERLVTRNNKTFTAFCLGTGDVRPTIYPESIYEAAMSSASEEETMGEILNRALEGISEALSSSSSTMDVSDITSIVTDWNRVKDLVCIRVVGSESNPYLSDKVYTEPAPGLAAMYYIPLQSFMPAENGAASVAVTDAMFEAWGITFDTLNEAAVANTTAESDVRKMADILRDMLPAEFVEAGLVELPTDETMLVITNKSRFYGNGGVLCPEVMALCAKELGTDKLAILPSSTHESIVIPGNMAENPEELTSMVGEVNSTQVAADERVCDMAYFYETATGAITPISAGMAA